MGVVQPQRGLSNQLSVATGGKARIERHWGTNFINVAGLTKYMGAVENCVPRSWLLTFTDGSDEVTAQCYLHTSDYAPQGWYSKFGRVIKLSKQFKMLSVKAGTAGESGSNSNFPAEPHSILDG